MIIGVTGIFSSGKSTVSGILGSCGYKIINADKVGHAVLNKEDIKNKVIKEFGSSILTDDKIDKKKLKKIVFYDRRKLVKLNKIIHPRIIGEIKKIIKSSKNKKIVVDAALLIETNALKLVDKLIIVKIDKEVAVKRALKKNKYALNEIKNIFQSQLSQKEKLKYSDEIVDNSKSEAYTKKQVKKLIYKWQK